ncbi:hypothetical protein [Flavobacterium psychrotrophum]|uniref:hypothetical protein n=1 Tax=Flavobacterium psychrotrophum TaxID=2294119 RepID=UPI0013C5177A|nr:hypothetical protein [Flavobacterium psychrotrophum]
MESVTSKRSFFYYRSLAFFSLLIIVGIIFVLIFLRALIAAKLESHIFGLMCASLFIIPFSIYCVHKQITKVYSFSITKNAITVKGKICPITDIVNINFTGKQDYPGLSNMDGMKIKFKGNKVLYIYDCYYSNISQIKSYLNNVWPQTEEMSQQPVIITTPLNNIQPWEDHFYFHKGRIFTYILLLAILFFALALFILCSMSFYEAMAILILPLSFIIALSTNLYYFGIGGHFIIVKNFAYPWVKKSYAIQQIREIIFEKNGNNTNSMTVVTNDFTTKKYYTITLYGKHWEKLISGMIAKGIKVK